jgi:quercetin dioxygenase-like cupin family protein
MHRVRGRKVAQIGKILAGDRAAGAQQQQPEIQRKLLLHQDLPIPGYQVVVSLVEIPAGMVKSGIPIPARSRITVTEGTLILETAGRPRTTHKAGDTFSVDAGKVHRDINTSNAPVKIVATLVAEKGLSHGTDTVFASRRRTRHPRFLGLMRRSTCAIL